MGNGNVRTFIPFCFLFSVRPAYTIKWQLLSLLMITSFIIRYPDEEAKPREGETVPDGRARGRQSKSCPAIALVTLADFSLPILIALF
jgi:hypothetical protein